MTPELIAILEAVKARITDDSDLMWTSFETAKELRDELDIATNQLKDGDYSCLDKLEVYFAPACTFQDHSLQNGWHEEYMKLAEEFDQICEQMENHLYDNNT